MHGILRPIYPTRKQPPDNRRARHVVGLKVYPGDLAEESQTCPKSRGWRTKPRQPSCVRFDARLPVRDVSFPVAREPDRLRQKAAALTAMLGLASLPPAN